MIERLAVDEFHREVGRTLGTAEAKVPDDVRVLELLEDLRLTLEALDGGFIAGQADRHDLESDLAAVFVLGAIHGAHRAAAELALDGEGADALAGHCHRSTCSPLRILFRAAAD